MVDLSQTIEPKSDQINADDFTVGPRTFTIEKVTGGTAEQPINIHLVESPGKPWRPSKTMRRLLVAVWGADGEKYGGRRLTLYRDPTVKFGGDEVGGIKVSHLSHIDKPVKIALTVTRGKRQPHSVAPLVEAAPTPVVTVEQVGAASTVAELRAMWAGATPDVQALIKARVDELGAGNA